MVHEDLRNAKRMCRKAERRMRKSNLTVDRQNFKQLCNKTNELRDRPFNLQGGYGFLFRSEICFRTTREFEYLFFLSCKARNFFPEFNIRLYDKNSESDYIFFLHHNQNIFFSNIGNQNIFLEKKTPPPPPPPFKLNGRSLINFSY
jgi:hypothetical protein